MNKVDRISKDAKILIDSAKDTVSNNFVSAVKSSSLSLSESQLASVLNLVNVCLQEGYQKALPYFQNSVKRYVDQ